MKKQDNFFKRDYNDKKLLEIKNKIWKYMKEKNIFTLI